MSLLSEIRDLAADNSVPLETVLLKCMVLADILGDEALMQWLSQELDGYLQRGDVPEYRVVGGRAMAKVTNGVRYETIDVSQAALPPGVPLDAPERLRTIWFTDGVKSLEAIQARDDLVRSLDSDLFHSVEQNLRAASGYWIREAYIPIGPGVIAGILGSIRSRVLQYIFRLRRDFPEFDRDPTVKNAPTPAQLNQLFHVAIGHGSAVTFGGGSAYAQSIGQQVIAGNLKSLKTYLGELGVEQSDLDALDTAIAGAKPEDLENKQSRIRRWIENVSEKASAGGKEIAKTATREVIQTAVKYFLGTFLGIG